MKKDFLTSFTTIKGKYGMSDLREELEQRFASAETQSETSNTIEEQPQVQEPVIDEWMDAPKSYTKEFQDKFKELSPEWRKNLIEREKQIERGFSDLGNKANAYNWVNDAYNSRQARLAQNGINKAQDYFNLLAQIDDALASDPRGTIQTLAESYGVNFGDNNNASNDFRKELNDIRQSIYGIQAYNQAQQRNQAAQAYNEFVNAKDEAGNLKHPYLDEVREDMSNLLKSGVSQTLEDAYNRAIWTNEAVRNKLIAAKSQAELNSKVAEAGKAKAAGFNPSSKSEPVARELSEREEIEALFDKAGL